MWQETGLIHHKPAHGDEVVDGGLVAVLPQPVQCGGITDLRSFSQGEERFRTPRGRPGASDVEDFLGSEVGGPHPGGRLGECAVSTSIPAQHGEGDEHLGGVGDSRPRGRRTPLSCSGQQFVERDVNQVGGGHERHHNGALGLLGRLVHLSGWTTWRRGLPGRVVYLAGVSPQAWRRRPVSVARSSVAWPASVPAPSARRYGRDPDPSGAGFAGSRRTD